jgi:hypothetical protein
MQRRSFGRRVNQWLAEPKGQTFRDGKWRFWYPTLLSLTALNAFLTAVIFGNDAQKYIGPVVLLAGAVLCWLALGLLHYSDSEDRALAIGVAMLDSLSLLFVAAHFSFLVWVYGHAGFLRAAESKYQRDLAEYNAQWKPVAESNDRIAQTAERIAEIEKQTERLRNDTAYWSRKNGVKQAQSGIKVELSTTKVEIPPPPKAPADSSVEYLARWDAYVRLAGFGELGLSIITLIFVRTRTAARNRIMSSETIEDDGDFPEEIDIEKRSPSKHERLENAPAKSQRKKKLERINDSFDSGQYAAGAQALRDALKDISFRLKGYSFKVTIKPDCVWIMMVESNQGTQQTVSSARCDLAILQDAQTMPRDKFRAKLERTLKRGGFEI